MAAMERSLLHWLRSAHPEDKMVLLSGPRQVGKTTMAKAALEAWKEGALYFSWDIATDRRRILKHEDLLSPVRGLGRRPMVVFDELHKMPRFKSWLKGWHDEYGEECLTWVTGSGRLDLYQRDGDSLLGRYFPYRLHPLSVAELRFAPKKAKLPEPEASWEAFAGAEAPRGLEDLWRGLFRFGGFPEPFLKQSASFHTRWVNTRRGRVTQEDIRDLTRIQDVARLELLVDLLASRVGSPLSLNALSEDLGVAFETVRSWVEALARTYYVFAVAPYAKRLSRVLSKARKAYLWDWSEVPEEAARFENLVACHLLKACHVWTDLGCGRFDLWYVRDRQKREVDFVITEGGDPWLLVECKVSDPTLSPALVAFGRALSCKRLVQVVSVPGVREVRRIGDVRIHVVSAAGFLSHLA